MPLAGAAGPRLDRAHAAGRGARDRALELPAAAAARPAGRRPGRRATPWCSSPANIAPATSAALARLDSGIPGRAPSRSSRAASRRPRRCWPSASTTSSSPADEAAAKVVLRGRRRAPDPGDPGARRQIPGLRRRDRRPGRGGQADRLGQVHERRADLRRRPTTSSPTGDVAGAAGAPSWSRPSRRCSATTRRGAASYGRIVNDRHFDRLAGAARTPAPWSRRQRDAGQPRTSRRPCSAASPGTPGDAGGDLRPAAAPGPGRRAGRGHPASINDRAQAAGAVRLQRRRRTPGGASSPGRPPRGRCASRSPAAHLTVAGLPFGGVGEQRHGRLPRGDTRCGPSPTSGPRCPSRCGPTRWS